MASWAGKLPIRDKSEIENTLLDLRTIRNNVFHGGKFPDGPVDEPLRDQKLIVDCLALLSALLELPELQNSVARYFKPGN